MIKEVKKCIWSETLEIKPLVMQLGDGTTH